MIQAENHMERHTIPRWLNMEIASKLGEMESSRKKEPERSLPAGTTLSELLEEWKIEKNLPLAIEIIAANELNSENHSDQLFEIKEFARSRLQNIERVPPALLTLIGDNEHIPIAGIRPVDVASIKKNLSEYPRNPLMWTELARQYLINGYTDKSERAIKVAYGLAPNNRTVLRAIARFYSHIEDYAQARYYLQKSPKVKTDPWVLSAEIAICNQSGITSTFTKTGQRMLESGNYQPNSLSELGSELATMDFFSAKSKQGKRKLEAVVSAPHENAVAQLIWLDEHVYRIQPILERVKKPLYNYEAESMSDYFRHDFVEAAKAAKEWRDYQPFSSKPITWMSYLLSDFLCKYEDACSVLKTALKGNQTNVVVLNNYAYALISTGNTNEAEHIIKLAKRIGTSQCSIPFMATEGFLAYRTGNRDLGREKYEQAVQMAKEVAQKTGDQRTLFEVYIHFAREELVSGHDISTLSSIISSRRFSKLREEFETVLTNFGLAW